jgi:dihydrofolate reductase
MRTLTYSINVTLDGCIDHRAGWPDVEIHQLATEALAQADGLLLGRVTYELMEQSWRPPASDAFPDWMQPFARTIHEIPKYVASTTLESVDWNTELLGGDRREATSGKNGRPEAWSPDIT